MPSHEQHAVPSLVCSLGLVGVGGDTVLSEQFGVGAPVPAVISNNAWLQETW